ncbi:MAG: glutaredoxin domain-containing protein [Verrucomicrobia bacterium]|nr:glutaredoxin domain-containing protein [Verrucomicrobiota bacterium]
MRQAPDIEIYYAEVCGLCHRAMDYFRTRDLPFQAHEVHWQEPEFVDSENTRAMYRRCGAKVDFVPQIFINGRHIPGWRKLEPMIQSGEIERVLWPEG